MTKIALDGTKVKSEREAKRKRNIEKSILNQKTQKELLLSIKRKGFEIYQCDATNSDWIYFCDRSRLEYKFEAYKTCHTKDLDVIIEYHMIGYGETPKEAIICAILNTATKRKIELLESDYYKRQEWISGRKAKLIKEK